MRGNRNKEKDLRRLSRRELLDLLVRFSEEREALRNECDTLRRRLQSKKLAAAEAGSIAEAALAVNRVCESAQAAADQYLDNIARLQDEAAARAEEILREAEEKAAAIRAEAEQTAAPRPKQTQSNRQGEQEAAPRPKQTQPYRQAEQTPDDADRTPDHSQEAERRA